MRQHTLKTVMWEGNEQNADDPPLLRDSNSECILWDERFSGLGFDPATHFLTELFFPQHVATH